MLFAIFGIIANLALVYAATETTAASTAQAPQLPPISIPPPINIADITSPATSANTPSQTSGKPRLFGRAGDSFSSRVPGSSSGTGDIETRPSENSAQGRAANSAGFFGKIGAFFRGVGQGIGNFFGRITGRNSNATPTNQPPPQTTDSGNTDASGPPPAGDSKNTPAIIDSKPTATPTASDAKDNSNGDAKTVNPVMKFCAIIGGTNGHEAKLAAVVNSVLQALPNNVVVPLTEHNRAKGKYDAIHLKGIRLVNGATGNGILTECDAATHLRLTNFMLTSFRATPRLEVKASMSGNADTFCTIQVSIGVYGPSTGQREHEVNSYVPDSTYEFPLQNQENGCREFDQKLSEELRPSI